MQIRIYILIIISLLVNSGYSQNVIQINSGIADLNDTLEIHVRISNDQAFIAFQCDVLTPESFLYIDNSAQLSDRENGHSLTVFELSDTVLRFMSYSALNNFFTGDTGNIMCFKVLSGNITGVFDLEIQNGIIADSLSQNILDQSIDGTWYIGPVGITETKRSENMTVFPNPGSQEQIRIYLEVQNPTKVQVQLFTTDCQLLITENLYLPKSKNYLNLRDIVKDISIYPGVYFLIVSFTNDNKETMHFEKLILTDY